MIFLDPFLVSGDIEDSKTLENSLIALVCVCVCVSRGWIVPRDEPEDVGSNPEAHLSFTHTHTN